MLVRPGDRLLTTALEQRNLTALHHDAKAIFTHALRGCNIAAAFDRHLHFEGKTLVRHPSPVVKPLAQKLDDYKKVMVVSFGKAALPMLDALLDRLPSKLKVEGICAAPDRPAKRHKHIRYFECGHPLPNEDSLNAARASLELLKHAKKDSFVFFLISGGGSAMLELPYDSSISLDDTRAFHETLVASGATIIEINKVRKYFSAVKGGRLAQAAPDAEKLSLLVADIAMKDLAAVSSSPTLPDTSTPEECAEVLARYRMLERFPASVREYFQSLATHGPKPVPASVFEHSSLDTLLSNHDFMNAARDHARSLGYKVVLDDSCDNWDYADAAKYLLERFHELRRQHSRLCLLSSGEVTVAMQGHTGCGGRNQHFALKTAFDLEQHPEEAIAVLSAGSDGIDGNSAAAGAIADPTTLTRARQFRFKPEESLATFNSCPLFTALGDSIVTGPTGNNLRDLRILLAG